MSREEQLLSNSLSNLLYHTQVSTVILLESARDQLQPLSRTWQRVAGENSMSFKDLARVATPELIKELFLLCMTFLTKIYIDW